MESDYKTRNMRRPMIFTCDKEVIMFSPFVFACLCVSAYVCHDVRSHVSNMYWCHTNNILQVYSWRYLIVPVMFHTTWRHRWRHQVTKWAKYWNWYISINISYRASIKYSQYRKCQWLSCWYIQLPVSLPVKMFVATSKWRPLWKFWNIKQSVSLNSDSKKIAPNYAKKFLSMGKTSSTTSRGGLKVGPLYSFINEIRARFIKAKDEQGCHH